LKVEDHAIGDPRSSIHLSYPISPIGTKYRSGHLVLSEQLNLRKHYGNGEPSIKSLYCEMGESESQIVPASYTYQGHIEADFLLTVSRPQGLFYMILVGREFDSPYLKEDFGGDDGIDPLLKVGSRRRSSVPSFRQEDLLHHAPPLSVGARLAKWDSNSYGSSQRAYGRSLLGSAI